MQSLKFLRIIRSVTTRISFHDRKMQISQEYFRFRLCLCFEKKKFGVPWVLFGDPKLRRDEKYTVSPAGTGTT